MNPICRIATLAVLASTVITAEAGGVYPVNYEAAALFNASTGSFAPHYVSAMRHGVLTAAANNALARGRLWRPMTLDTRFSYGFCADMLAGWGSSNDYLLYQPTGDWTSRPSHAPRIWLQQLYAELKYRGVFLTVGLKEHTSALLDERLSSGDLVESGNSRPIPEARIGFIDFQNIPFTNGWVQIQGEIGYGRMTDGDWWLNRYNRYNYHVNTGEWYNYKRCYFRTKPSERLSVTVGMQAAATFGGDFYRYDRGNLLRETHKSPTIKMFWNAFLPIQGSGEDFYEGNHLGSWDFIARYDFASGHQVKAYFQWPWEDGSGIGRRNGWDGLWGLEWQSSNRRSVISGAVVEYIDMTNQSGPTHYAPGDFPGTTVTSEATGADDYYNNQYYNAYAYYGMSIGTPMMMAPIYNLDGYPAYVASRMRGFHAAAEGSINDALEWRVMGGYRVGYGNGRVMLRENIHTVSMAADVVWRVPYMHGLSLTGMVALDHGTMPGNSFGVMLSVSYAGLLNIPHR